jgi:hypothetical protein
MQIEKKIRKRKTSSYYFCKLFVIILNINKKDVYEVVVKVIVYYEIYVILY